MDVPVSGAMHVTLVDSEVLLKLVGSGLWERGGPSCVSSKTSGPGSGWPPTCHRGKENIKELRVLETRRP